MQQSKFLRLILKFHLLKEEVATFYFLYFFILFTNLFFFVEITNVEGIITRCIAGLQQDQPARQTLDPESAEKIEEFIKVLIDLKDLKKAFTLVSLPIAD